MSEIKRPDEWNIKIWKEDGIWHEKYMEYVINTKENKELLTNTIILLKKLMKNCFPLDNVNITEIKKDNMIGLEIFVKTSNFKAIANQLTSEFIYFSDFGDVTIKSLFNALLRIGIKSE